MFMLFYFLLIASSLFGFVALYYIVTGFIKEMDVMLTREIVMITGAIISLTVMTVFTFLFGLTEIVQLYGN